MAKRTKKLIENTSNDTDIRVNKYLSDAGVCSRREADKYISEGRVTIDGITAVMGSKIQKGQVILLDGKAVDKDESLVLIAFHKPRGIVCTTDKREKDNIIDFIQYPKRIYPIGRLDKDSEGLILLTNDGDIVNKILRAGNNHEKEYIVTLNKAITSEFLKGMAAGVPILDTITRPCPIKALDKFTFQIILTQGLNRQIRRMCEYFDYKVLSLKRIRIMNINLGYLQVGGYRNVTEKEIAGLNELISNSVNTPDDIWNSLEDASDDALDKSLKVKHFKAPGNSNKKNVTTSVSNREKIQKDISKKSTNKKGTEVTKLNKETTGKESNNKKNLQKNNIKINTKGKPKENPRENPKGNIKGYSKVNKENKINHVNGGSSNNLYKSRAKVLNKSNKSTSRGSK